MVSNGRSEEIIGARKTDHANYGPPASLASEARSRVSVLREALGRVGRERLCKTAGNVEGCLGYTLTGDCMVAVDGKQHRTFKRLQTGTPELRTGAASRGADQAASSTLAPARQRVASNRQAANALGCCLRHSVELH